MADLRPKTTVSRRVGCPDTRTVRTIHPNKTRQGYTRKRILKPAGYFFVQPIPAPLAPPVHAEGAP